MKQAIAIILAILSFTACKRSGPHYLLRLKYNKGVQTDLEYHTYVVSDDDETNAIRNEVVRMGFKVDSVIHDSLFVLSAKVDYIRVVQNEQFALLNFSFDTEAPPTGNDRTAATYNHFIKPMVDSSLRLVLNNKGGMAAPFTFSRGGKLPGPGPLNYEMCQVPFPADPVAIGEEWPASRVSKADNATWTSHYYIEDITDSKINIKLYGVIEQGSKTNKFTGDYAIDQKTGGLISGKITVVGKTSSEDKGKLVIDIRSREWGTM